MGNLVRVGDAMYLDLFRPDVKREVYAESETYSKKYFLPGVASIGNENEKQWNMLNKNNLEKSCLLFLKGIF